jgi:hypothetical protein
VDVEVRIVGDVETLLSDIRDALAAVVVGVASRRNDVMLASVRQRYSVYIEYPSVK